MKKTLTNWDFLRASKELKCEPEAIMAVDHVESLGTGFYADGFPTILFERHKFYKNAPKNKRVEWERLYPDICNSAATPRGKYGNKQMQRVKFSRAFRLDPDAAMEACSWGRFQELGENYIDYGFKNVGEFVDLMKSGVDGHLEIFIRSIKHRGLADELRDKNFAGFARNYNGPNYRTFGYDDQMLTEYKAFKKLKIDWSKVQPETQFHFAASVTKPIEDFLEPDDTIETEDLTAGLTTPQPEQFTPAPPVPAIPVPQTSVVTPVIEIEQIKPEAAPTVDDKINKWSARYAAIPTAITGAMFTGLAWLKDSPVNLIIALAGATAAVIVIYVIAKMTVTALKESRKDKLAEAERQRVHEMQMLQAESAASQQMNAIKFVPPSTEVDTGNPVPPSQEIQVQEQEA